MLNSEDRIDNDFEIDQKKFYIITGANMAGKSTFLRTVGLSIVMANVGLPVCAETFRYKPLKLITSMRTSDSLANNESYFYSELKRLKFIVDLMNNDEYFIGFDMIVPHKLAFHFCKLELIVVHFGDNAWRPMVRKFGELLIEIDFRHEVGYNSPYFGLPQGWVVGSQPET